MEKINNKKNYLPLFKRLKIQRKCRFVDDKGDIIFNESMFKRECEEELRKTNSN